MELDINNFKTFQNPKAYTFEEVACYQCQSRSFSNLLIGQDDLTGRKGNFRYVTCKDCGLSYQNPRLDLDSVKEFYDNDYIAHRKKTDWGILTPLYEWAMNKHDREKQKIVSRYLKFNESTEILDVGCAVGTFLAHMKKKHNCSASGIDFVDLSAHPNFSNINFYNGVFSETQLPRAKFDLITMWHFLEHDYKPAESLAKSYEALKPDGRLVIEVPRLDSFSYELFKERWPGVQAPQHTILFNKNTFMKFIESHNFEIVDYLPYGAFPSYFYLFMGAKFKKLQGRGVDLNKVIVPYFAGQLLLSPILLFEKYLNLSMQTIVCRKKSS